MWHTRQKQQGSVFLISLMLLIVITLLTFSVSETVMLQEKMTTSNKEDVLAFHSAEAALLQGEAAIRGLKKTDFINAFTLTGGTAGKRGFYDGTSCDGTNPYCYMNTLRDVFTDTTWVNAIDTQTVNCGTGDPYCWLTGQYVVIKLGPIVPAGVGGRLQAVTNQYQNQGAEVIAPSWKYKVIAKGVDNNKQNTRVLISYFVQSEPSN